MSVHANNKEGFLQLKNNKSSFKFTVFKDLWHPNQTNIRKIDVF